MVLRILVMATMLLCLSSTASVLAQKADKVMILNSDASIKRYLTAQALFKAEFSGKTFDVNLGDRWLSEEDFTKILEKEKPTIIYAIGSKAYVWASRVDRDIKIVFSSLLNWSRLHIDKRTCGIATELKIDMQMTLFRYLFPEIKQIGILYSKEFNREIIQKIKESAKNLDIEIIGKIVEKPEEVQGDLETLFPEIHALWLIADPIVLADSSIVRSIFETSDRAKTPVFTYNEVFINFGATLILSSDIPTMAKQVSMHIREIQSGNGHKLNNVVNPAGSQIILNMREVREYGLKLNQEALSSVNKVIE